MAAKLKLKAVVEKLDDVPEAHRALYEERDGKFYLEVDGLEDASGIKKNRDEILKEKKKLEEKLRLYGELTPDEAEELRRYREKTEEEVARKAGEFDKLKGQMVEKHQKEIDKLTRERDDERALVDKTMRESAARRALQKHDGTELLFPHVVSRLKLERKDGALNVIVVDAAGNQQVDAKGNAVSPEDFVAGLKTQDEYKGGFRGPGASGSGAENRPGGAGAGAKVVAKGDLVGFGQNLESIAKGETVIQ